MARKGEQRNPARNLHRSALNRARLSKNAIKLKLKRSHQKYEDFFYFWMRVIKQKKSVVQRPKTPILTINLQNYKIDKIF
jgi:hypothetical protein